MFSDGVALLCPGESPFTNSLKSNLKELFDEDDIIPVSLKSFANRELYAQIMDNVRRKIAIILWNFQGRDGDFDPDVGYQWLHIMNDAAWRASASEINNMHPYIPYLRQDRKDKPRSPITASKIARQIEKDHVNRVTAVDPHFKQVQGFYDLPVDLLPFYHIFAEEIFDGNTDKKYVIVAPDVGSTERADNFQKYVKRKYGLDIPIAILRKERDTKTGISKVKYMVGDPADIDGATVIEIDDIIGTAGTITDGGIFLREKYKAKEIIACGTHGEFNYDDEAKVSAETRIKDSGIRIITSDSVPKTTDYIENNADWLTVKSLGPVFAEAAKRTYKGKSLSSMWQEY